MAPPAHPDARLTVRRKGEAAPIVVFWMEGTA